MQNKFFRSLFCNKIIFERIRMIEENTDEKPKTRNIYKIDIKKYEIIKSIKEGDFDCVYSIRDKETHEGFSATTIYYSRENKDYKQIVTREINIMMEIRHPTLINFIGYSLKDFDGKKNITILMDHFKNISLSYVIKKARTRPDEIDFDNTDRQIILIGIARGMMFLHQNHIIHRDLNPSNIFLDEECEPHIIGHGFSKIHLTDQNKKTINQCEPTVYMAPETIKDNIYDTKTDVYSFGILMYELITNQIPFPELTNGEVTEQQIKTALIEKGLQPTFSVDIKKPIKELIESCWSKNPAERPTFEYIFYKLSFNEWDIEFHENDDNEEEEEKGEYKINYFLDDVYRKRVFQYVDKIKEKSSVSDLLSRINSQEQEIESMKKEIEQLKKLQTGESTENAESKNSNKNDEEIKKMKNEIEQLKKLQITQKSHNELNLSQNDEIENMKKEIEELKKLQIDQIAKNKNDDEIENMKKEIKQLKKLQKSQESESSGNSDDDEIQKLKKELSDQQKINNALIQHIKKMKASFKELSSKYEEITTEHTNHIQILAKEVRALKTAAKEAKQYSEEIIESSSKDEHEVEVDLEGGLIEPFGIVNNGGFSYINASLQCLLSLPLFVEQMDSLIANSSSKPILLSLFKSFIASEDHNPSKIKQIVSQKSSLISDSFQFTSLFIDVILEESQKGVADLFIGKFQMITKCTKCMNESIKEQEFSSINFSIKNMHSMVYIPFNFKENPIELKEKPKPNSKIQIMNSKTSVLIGQFVLMAKVGNQFKLIDDFQPDYSAIYAFELNSNKKGGSPLTVVQVKDKEGSLLTMPFICEIPNLTFVNEDELKTIVINRMKDILPVSTRSKIEELKKYIKFTKPNKFPHRFKTSIKTPMFCTSYVNVKILKKDVFNFTERSLKIQRKKVSLLNLFNCHIQQYQLEKCECEKCRNMSRVFHRVKYLKLPQILIFNLKRFDGLNDDSIPDETEISFPHSISFDLDESFNKLKINPDENEKSGKYELRAISHHSGLFKSGNNWANGKRANKWYELNDAAVDSISEPSEPTQSSYIAFYQHSS